MGRIQTRIPEGGSHLIVVSKDGEFLLIQRRDVPFWVIPGGHIEAIESPSKAARRELQEELGIRIGAVDLIARYCSPKSGKVKFLYRGFAKDTVASKIQVDEEEVRNFGWFTMGNLPKPISLYETHKLQDFLSYSDKVIKREDKIELVREVINQMKFPITFVWLLFSFLINRIFGTKSFNLQT